MKKGLSLLIILTMLMSVFSVQVFATASAPQVGEEVFISKDTSGDGVFDELGIATEYITYPNGASSSGFYVNGTVRPICVEYPNITPGYYKVILSGSINSNGGSAGNPKINVYNKKTDKLTTLNATTHRMSIYEKIDDGYSVAKKVSSMSEMDLGTILMNPTDDQNVLCLQVAGGRMIPYYVKLVPAEVSGDETFTLRANNHTSTTKESTQSAETGINSGEKLTYELNVKNSGKYNFVFECGADANDVEAIIYIGDEEVGREIITSGTWSNHMTTDGLDVTLPAGKVSLTIQTGTQGGLRPRSFSLIPIEVESDEGIKTTVSDINGTINNLVSGTLTITGEATGVEPGAMIAALYEENTLLKIAYGDTDLSATLITGAFTQDKNYTLKVFYWDSLVGMRPLATAFEMAQ